MTVLPASARALWESLSRIGGISPRDYDQSLIVALKRRLNIPDDGREFGRTLDVHDVSVERFVGAFFSCLEPFALMMSDLCEFLERYGVTKTGNALRLRFKFEDVGKELTFDLSHFREALRVWDLFRQVVDVVSWDTSTIWRLYEILANNFSGPRDVFPRNDEALSWVRVNSYRARAGASDHWTAPPPPSILGIPEVDFCVARIHAAIDQLVATCAPYGSFKSLRKIAQENRDAEPVAGRDGNSAPISQWHVKAYA